MTESELKSPPSNNSKDNEYIKSINFDYVLPLLGEFGRYEKRIYFLLCLPVICCAMHKLAWVFLGAKVDHRCQLPIEYENATFSQLPNDVEFNMTFPWDDEKAMWSQCKRLDVNFSDNSYFNSGVAIKDQVSCGDNYVFDTSNYASSATIEYKLVCENSQFYTLANTLFMVGVLFGSILFGDLSDRFGRRPIFFLSLVMQVGFGILAGLVTNYTAFVTSRLIVGMTTSGVSLVGFVIAMEMVGPSKRMVAGTVWQFFFTTGYLVVVPFAYFIKDWKMLQVAISVPGLIFLSYYWFLPESIRWLLSQGRRDEAKALLRNVAKENRVELSEDIYEGLCDEKASNANTLGILTLFHYPRMAIRSLILFVSWLVNSGVYYGLSLNTSNLGGNDYLNFAVSGAVEIPAYTFLLLSLNRFGRKYVLCGSMFAGGVFMVACGFIPTSNSWNWLLITCAMIGKMCITASYGVVYILSAESFPTVVRNAGVGAGSMFARVGGILQGYVLLLGDHWKPLPMVIFGAATLISGLFGLLIPETFGKRLPETLEDGEKFGTREYDAQSIESDPVELQGRSIKKQTFSIERPLTNHVPT